MGNARTNADGTTLTTCFLPQALRRQKNPAQVSNALSENRRGIKLMTAATDTLKKYKSDMTDILKELAGLEIKVKKEQLCTDFLKHCRFFAEASIIIRRSSNYSDNDPARDIEVLKHETVLQLLATINGDAIEALFLTNKNSASMSYKQIYPLATTRGANWNNDINTLFNLLRMTLMKIMIGMSTNIFCHAKQKEKVKPSTAALHQFVNEGTRIKNDEKSCGSTRQL